jgi:S-DNA-T family DNA segregation ATPase FtsK/SpoIIIE
MAETTTRDADGGTRRWLGLALLPVFLFALLGLLTYDWRDIGWLQSPPNRPPANLIGLFGAWSTFFGYHLFGLGLWLVPVWIGAAAVMLLTGRGREVGVRTAWASLFLLALCGLLQLGDAILVGTLDDLNMDPDAGGAIGYWLMTCALQRWLSPVGGGILAVAVLIFAGVMTVGPARLSAVARGAAAGWRAWRQQRAERRARAEAARLEAEQIEAEREERKAAERGFSGGRVRSAERGARSAERGTAGAERGVRSAERDATKEDAGEADPKAAAAAARDEAAEGRKDAAASPPSALRTARSAAPAASSAAAAVAPPGLADYRLPGIEILDPLPEGEAVHGDTAQMAQLLVDTLAQFSLSVTVEHVERGPVVTRYELLPAAGIRVERIAQLAHTLQMVLKATSLRIQAPVPGKNVVGVEVPNPVARKVTLREILQGGAWATQKMEIPLALGKDVGGSDIVFDLTAAPHLLVAGATGSGKSVCLNAILAGLLLSRRPDEVKLLLIDPKRVEFPPYNNLPHLLVPVVTDPRKVSFALRWVIAEMERRYKLLQTARVRNIVAYNSREQARQGELALEGLGGEGGEAGLPARMPYIVIVIDEVADLMLTVGPDIEMSITRLAQLSRAVGIHMVLATQRPSVNVITGTIKANFPARIAFQVAQKTDSRTILDQQGAESLIGRGDMLFLNPKNGRLIRAQGALVNDAEIGRLVEFVKGQVGPDFDQTLATRLDKLPEGPAADEEDDEAAAGAAAADDGDDADEDLIQKCIQVIRDTRRASTSSLQRRLRIGYTRAARIMDILEERGIVGPPRGADPREILIDLDAGMPDTGASDQTPAAADGAEDEK